MKPSRIQLRLQHVILAAALAWGCLPLGGEVPSLTVEELANRIVDNEKIFLIDLRPGHQYRKGHIPGAVSIPLRQLASRRLPALGEVVVYGDGFGKIDVEEALEVLERKDGIVPVVLAGGYAAWEARSGVTTEASGFRKSHEPIITYQDLKDIEGRGTVVYDLRRQPGGSDLKAHFPQARVVSGDPHQQLGTRSAAMPQAVDKADAGNPLLRVNPPSPREVTVLVDDDHATAAKVARRLRAGGLRKVVVLAGGELSVKTEGRSGLERTNQRLLLTEEDGTASEGGGERQP